MEVDEIKKVRIEKLHKMEALNVLPYGGRFPETQMIQSVLDPFVEQREVTLAGRVMANRKHGKVMFMDLMDKTGQIQLFVKADNVGPELFEVVKLVDIGDMVGVSGVLFLTQTGEKSVRLKNLTVLTKSIMCLPEK